MNGLRKLVPLARTFDSLSSDIICIQETRVSSADDPDLESLAFVPGYYSFFSICRTRAGYSGVATFCRKSVATPVAATNSLGDHTGGTTIPSEGQCDLGSRCACLGAGYNSLTLKAVHDEGRFVLTDHQHFVLINVYVPATSVQNRAAFKLSFLHALKTKITALNKLGRRVILVGDLNICPARIDSAERIRLPPDPEWDQRPARVWLSRLVTPPDGLLVDSFRLSYPTRRDAFTCWSEAMQGRKTNYGVRIDLIFIHRSLAESTNPQADIWNHIMGSDHCPVSLNLNSSSFLSPLPNRPPPFCTQLLPRFAKRQQSITRYFFKSPQVKQVTANNTDSEIEITRTNPDLKKNPTESQEFKHFQATSSTNPTSSRPLSLQETKTVNNKLQPAKTIIKTTHKRTSSSNSIKCKGAFQKTLCLSKRSENAAAPVISQQNSGAKSCAKGSTTTNNSGNNNSHNQSLSQQTQTGTNSNNRKQISAEWRKLLCGPKKPPMCRHGEPCVLKKVNKSGENKGRTFFSCRYPHGIGPHTNCNFFKWAPFDARFPTASFSP